MVDSGIIRREPAVLFAIFLMGLPIPLGLLVAAESERPNILLVLADDLGYSDLGCYGGEIRTPRLDALAADGMRMTQMYNAARCCSTRASLLTGLYPHQAGVGAMSADNQLPGYRGFLTDRCVTLASLLRDTGYQTYMSGKWHLRGVGDPNCIPTTRGFDEFFGHFHAYASYYRSDLFVRLPANRQVRQYDDGEFYATNAITDHALDFIQAATASDSPFFLYLAYNAPHFPLQAPSTAIDSYVPVYDRGWDQIRQDRYRRMLQSGVIPSSVRLSPRGLVSKVPDRNSGSPYYGRQIPAWNTLALDRQRDLVRRMSTYAAMVEIMDSNIGRVIDRLQSLGELENTLLVFLSDNGACAEWDPFGFDDNPYPENKLYGSAEIERMGGPETFHSYGTGWANACNTPFRLYKHYNHEGGISTPLIMHWPAGLSRAGEIERSPAIVMDLTATFLDLADAQYPAEYGGKPILPLAGRSLSALFEGLPLTERPIFFEHEGNRAVRLGKWKTVWANYRQTWELYDIAADRSETNDLADDLPDRVEDMARLWDQWAESHFVEKQQVVQPSAGMPKIYYQRQN